MDPGSRIDEHAGRAMRDEMLQGALPILFAGPLTVDLGSGQPPRYLLF